MIKRVYGKLDGVDIILQEKSGKWVVAVPINTNGAYIVEIIAEDDAGNIAYLTKMLFLVDKAGVHSYLVPLDYQGELLDVYRMQILDNGFEADVGYAFTVIMNNLYSVEVALL